MYVNGNRGSECYGYAIAVSRGVYMGVYYILMAHFPDDTC